MQKYETRIYTYFIVTKSFNTANDIIRAPQKVTKPNVCTDEGYINVV